MAYVKTPQQKTSRADIPSLLMTPSSSCGRAVFPGPPRALLSPPPLSFPPTPPPTRQEHTDILGTLFKGGFSLVTERILSYLNQDDISRCVLVSSSWRKVMSDYLTPPPKQPIITLDENNAEPSPEFKPFTERRQPLKTLANMTIKDRDPPKSCPLPLKRARLTMTPCPQCSSSAKVLSIRRAECARCSFEFCQKCLRSWHEQDSCGIQNISTSPKKSNPALIACGKGKKSRKNLRRL